MTGKRAKDSNHELRLQVTGTEMANTILWKEKAGIYWKALSEGYMDNKQICQWRKNEEDVKWSGLKGG